LEQLSKKKFFRAVQASYLAYAYNEVAFMVGKYEIIEGSKTFAGME
jgi:hypothetical protein